MNYVCVIIVLYIECQQLMVIFVIVSWKLHVGFRLSF